MLKGFIFHVRSRLERPDLIPYYLLLKVKKLFKIDFEKNTGTKGKKIDVVILTLPKDFELLGKVVQSLDKLKHPINKIFIIAPDNATIKDYCTKNNLHFVDERSLLGYGKDSIHYMVNGANRNGWIFQQLLKWSGDKFCEMEDYFIIDSDTIISSPFSLIEKDAFIFYQNEEWHQPYFKAFKHLFGYPTRNKLSFTSHMMIFNREMLRLIKKELETKHGKSWDQAYLSTIDEHEASCVSDYDNYANWVLCNFPERTLERPLYNKAFSRKDLEYIENNMATFGKKYKTISFHSYIK
jgi:hypothetical protein